MHPDPPEASMEDTASTRREEPGNNSIINIQSTKILSYDISY